MTWTLKNDQLPRPHLPTQGVEQNMRLRRGRLLSALLADELAPTLVTFPLMGVGDFVSPSAPAGGEASQSDFVPDTCYSKLVEMWHPRKSEGNVVALTHTHIAYLKTHHIIIVNCMVVLLVILGDFAIKHTDTPSRI